MHNFDDLSTLPDRFSGRVRLFPLPNLVLFPHVMQPLHIFERRYRDLMEDALAGDRLIAMALLAPGWERDYEGRPLIYPMTCLARIATHVRLADGTYNTLLLGLKRAKLIQELPPRRSFREAKIEICEDIYPVASERCCRKLQRKLRKAILKHVPSLPELHEHLDDLLETRISLGMLTDLIGYVLNIDLAAKQLLLNEPDVCRRTELLLDYLSDIEMTASSLSAVFPPMFSNN